ncbi:hypothetical protein HZA33_04605 [Candidatus Pacearchaeota archaeon]|nr:hypothetical protein [Candidatus Pacearchaeota archaeon]
MSNKIDLHVHPYFEQYNLENVVEAMQTRNLSAIGLIRYNLDHFEETRKIHCSLKAESDDLLIKVEKDGKPFYLLRGIEVLNEDFHLLVIGNTEGIKQGQSLEQNIEKALENGAIPVIDHPFVHATSPRKGICKEKRKKLSDVCKKYHNNIALEWNSYCIPWIRRMMLGNDANYDLEDFAEGLFWEAGDYVPVIADSDVHARNKSLLQEIGAGHIIIDGVDCSSGQKAILGLKEAIKEGEDFGYRNNKKCVSFTHFIRAFGLPLVLNLTKNRG